MRGWLLLTAQPWGRTYRSENTNPLNPEPSPAKIQCELYYKALCQSYTPSWIEAAELLAGGERWPSIGECRTAIQHAKAQPPKLTAIASQGIPQDDFGRGLFETIKTIAILRHVKEPHKADYREMLTAQFHALTDDEQAVVLGRYPDLAEL